LEYRDEGFFIFCKIREMNRRSNLGKSEMTQKSNCHARIYPKPEGKDDK